MNYDDIITLTQIMAINGDCPCNVGGWMRSEDYAGATHRRNGSVGEVVVATDTAYVCVRGCNIPPLPNKHPDYRPSLGTVWTAVPHVVDWRYVPSQYRDRAVTECRIATTMSCD